MTAEPTPEDAPAPAKRKRRLLAFGLLGCAGIGCVAALLLGAGVWWGLSRVAAEQAAERAARAARLHAQLSQEADELGYDPVEQAALLQPVAELSTGTEGEPVSLEEGDAARLRAVMEAGALPRHLEGVEALTSVERAGITRLLNGLIEAVAAGRLDAGAAVEIVQCFRAALGLGPGAKPDPTRLRACVASLRALGFGELAQVDLPGAARRAFGADLVAARSRMFAESARRSRSSGELFE